MKSHRAAGVRACVDVEVGGTHMRCMESRVLSSRPDFRRKRLLHIEPDKPNEFGMMAAICCREMVPCSSTA